MTLGELHARANESIKDGRGYLTLILPTKRPKGFPRGELMCVSTWGDRVYSVSARKVLAWLEKHGIETTGDER